VAKSRWLRIQFVKHGHSINYCLADVGRLPHAAQLPAEVISGIAFANVQKIGTPLTGFGLLLYKRYPNVR